MMHRKQIEELDLLALADGFLDDDPARKAEIETALLSDPQAASRLTDYRAQTSALRAAYAGTLVEPVPERLHAVLEGPDGTRARPIVRHMVAGLMIIAAGIGGWYVGYDDNPPGRVLLDESYRQFVMHGPEQSMANHGVDTPERAINWIDDEVAIRLSTPDLSAEGFKLMRKRAVRNGDNQLVALEYLAQDGRSFSLFIAPRWTERPGPIIDQERNGVALAYWHDGPLAASLATQLPQGEARALAERVRRAMRDDTTAPPAGLQPEFDPRLNRGQDMMVDTIGTTPQGGAAEATPGAAAPVVEAN